MKTKIDKVIHHTKILALAGERGMKISKAATRLGCTPIEAKAHSVASQVEFTDTAEGMVAAVRSQGHSCMKASPLAYKYWAETTIEGIRVMAVATYLCRRFAAPTG